jgi:D-tagatose-1,6-bisphosphate aldolase subunit GatZ/KbaZ
MDAAEAFRDRLHRNRAGARSGITSVCSAHPLVLDAAMRAAAARQSPLLIEATCNQVNQEGGYTGLTPAAFHDRMLAAAAAAGLPRGRLLLGGDHLGPNPWRALPAEEAMERALTMVAAYAGAGYRKLHLDASMACAGDPEPLPPELIAARAAQLCHAAEHAVARAGLPAPLYVIGTEVPTPGGAHEAEGLVPTAPGEVAHTVAVHRAAFTTLSLEAAMERVVAVVVQPGVEFSQDAVHDFDPPAAAALSAALGAFPGLVFEAHSTDYQLGPALAALVAGHFAILKVGPELTFALREAVFALDAIAAELAPDRGSGVRAALDAAMQADPHWWRGYHPAHARLARLFSLSDRIRYYWPVHAVEAALRTLLLELEAGHLPPTLVSQYLPEQYAAWREGLIALDPAALIRHRIGRVLERYADAAGEA